MKRSSSKLISKAGSVRNINKQGFKFKFELHVESVDKMMGTSDVVVTWERGAKILATKPAKIDKNTRIATFGGEALTQEITLFKKKKEGANFEEKVYRLTVRQANERGKVVGKIEIDFAEYVDIPSFSKRLGASLSSGGRIVMRVVSTYLGEAKGRKGSKGSRGTASIDSRDPGSDGFSSTPADEDDQRSERDTDLADLDDLDIDDDPVAAPAVPPQPVVKKANSLRGRGRPPNPPTLPEETPANGNSSGGFANMRRKLSTHSPRKAEIPAVAVSMDTPAESMPAAAPRVSRGRNDSDVGATNGTLSRAEFEKLKKENRLLRRKNEDLMQRNQDLEDRLAAGGDGDASSESIEQLMEENCVLRRDLGDLEAKLAREPVYSDVVRDLREAKMALAILTLEKDELTQEVRRYRKR